MKPVIQTRSKLEPIMASDLAGVSDEAKHIFIQRSASESPGFAYELSRNLPVKAVFCRIFDRSSSFSAEEYNAFESALFGGHFALARLWSTRRGRPKFRAPPDGAVVGQAWISALEAAMLSSKSDAEVWRARTWIWRAVSGAPLSGLTPTMIAQEAIRAFMAGRPELGGLCALKLMAASSLEISEATASGREWPELLSPSVWGDAKCDPAVYRKKVTAIDFASHRTRENMHPRRCGLLAHLRYWSEATRATHSELSASLENLSESLWIKGAFDTPLVHAMRFSEQPYGPEDVRAMTCSKVALEGAGLLFYDPSMLRPELVVFGAIVARCCASPDGPAGAAPGASWDAFLRAHPDAPQANPNPFATWSHSSCALLSLSGDSKLIELGLARGFSPDPSAWVLAAPGAMLSAFSAKKLSWPTLCSDYVDQKMSILPQGVMVHVLSSESLKKKPIQEGFSVRLSAKRLRQETAEAHPWTYQSLSSMALACGHNATAQALARAGGPVANFNQVRHEAPVDKHPELAELDACWQAEELFESTGGAKLAPKRGLGALRM